MNCNIHTIKAAFRPISCSTQQIDLQTCGNGTICSCAHTMQVCTPITTGMYSCLMYQVRVVLSEDGAMYAAASLATSAIPDKVLCCKFVYHTSKVSVGRVNIGYAWFSPVCINRMLYSVPGSAGLHPLGQIIILRTLQRMLDASIFSELFTCSGMVYGWTWTASIPSGPRVLSVHYDTNWEQWPIVNYNDSVIFLRHCCSRIYTIG